MNKANVIDGETGVAKRMSKLIKANQYLSDIESLDVLFPKLLALARDVIAAEAASQLLYNPKLSVLKFAFVADEVTGEKGGDILKRGVELKMGEGIAGWVAENRRALIIENVQQDPRFFRQADKKTGFVTRNLLSVPIIYGEELLGVINVLNAKDQSCFDAEDRELLEGFAHLIAVAVIRSRLLEDRLRRQKLQIQLEAASRIQSLFWPKIPKMGFGSQVWAVSEPAAFVGGDLYDFLPMPGNSWLVYVADVSDKGLPAALIMVALWSKIRAEAPLHEDVDSLLEAVNDAMYDLMAEEGFFATIILGRYWPVNGRLQFVCGGHLPPLWIRKAGPESFPSLKGLPLGVIPGTKFEAKEITLSPGESIIFLTDGVTETENDQAVLFGRDRLIYYIQNTNGPPWGKGLAEEIDVWRGAASANDDLTLVEIWRDPTRTADDP